MKRSTGKLKAAWTRKQLVPPEARPGPTRCAPAPNSSAVARLSRRCSARQLAYLPRARQPQAPHVPICLTQAHSRRPRARGRLRRFTHRCGPVWLSLATPSQDSFCQRSADSQAPPVSATVPAQPPAARNASNAIAAPPSNGALPGARCALAAQAVPSHPDRDRVGSNPRFSQWGPAWRPPAHPPPRLCPATQTGSRRPAAASRARTVATISSRCRTAPT